MFPYPSGKLHMGHVRVYTISDAVAHFHRMNGKQVLHPIGWDAFGLPAENAAIERGLQADEWTYSNIDYMRKQLKDLSMCFNWEREVTTCSPDYYRWTQYLFVKMFKAGLAYQKEALVNWDPVDQTVLANEQVDENGCSWRSGAKVEKRLLKQWFLKQQHYNKALVESLEDLPDWPSGVKTMQAAWIGDCDGCTFNFKLQINLGDSSFILPIHTPTPELIYGAAYIVLAPYHTLLSKTEFMQCLSEEVRNRIQKFDETTQDIDLGICAVHPLTNQLLPIYVSNSPSIFNEDETHIECRLGIPSASKELAEFAVHHGIDFVPVLVGEEDLDSDVLINSKQFSGLARNKGRVAVLDYVKDNNSLGEAWTSPRQHDWLVSRQRYWGTPLPIIHCEKCKAVPVPESDLPVILPKLKSVSGKGISPLLQATDWLNVKCPQCGGDAKRETDTMDTFVDSAWYFLRYTDPHNETEPFVKDKADSLMPVDMYVGGQEHALLHLLYARFFNHFIHDQKMVSHKEPFKRLLVQGLVKGQSYKVASTGQYLAPHQVDFSDDEPVAKETGEKLIVQWEKMSKSKHNGVNPEELLAKYGTDAVRMAVLKNVPPRQDMLWDEQDLEGDWIPNVWKLVSRFIKLRNELGNTNKQTEDVERQEDEIKIKCNETINMITESYQSRNTTLNLVINNLIGLANRLAKASDHIIKSSTTYERALCSLVIMVAPFAPHVTSEMWKGIAGVSNQVAADFDLAYNLSDPRIYLMSHFY
ncbi:probable leucine--tRNA ligase, mitochondrial [Amphiura filiformis]|uniref:probable leucine--tRNA ligase, mitochondrial n=1 Tax=Amphiura filiformis TaxID=82378 RepID=UPI003B20E6CE